MKRGAIVAVIVPAYQEHHFIVRTLETIPASVDLVVVVDDASTDGTAERVRGARDPRVRLIVHPRNRGVGAAIVSGYRCALEAGADVMVVMAGDNQMHPGDFESLVAPVLEGRADYAKGNRLVHRLAHDMPWERRIAGRVLGIVTSRVTGIRIGDSQCGYTALSAEAAHGVPLDELWPRYGYPNDLLGLLASRDFRVVDVPVRPVYQGEQSGVRAWHVLSVGWVIARRWWRERSRRERSRVLSLDPPARKGPVGEVA